MQQLTAILNWYASSRLLLCGTRPCLRMTKPRFTPTELFVARSLWIRILWKYGVKLKQTANCKNCFVSIANLVWYSSVIPRNFLCWVACSTDKQRNNFKCTPNSWMQHKLILSRSVEANNQNWNLMWIKAWELIQTPSHKQSVFFWLFLSLLSIQHWNNSLCKDLSKV